MPKHETDAYVLTRPDHLTSPVIFSSPHSGADYAPDLLAQVALSGPAVRSSEDAYVDQLFAMAPDLGAPLLAARVPRAFIDLNRAADELDPAVIEGIGRVAYSPRIASGLGVIPRVVAQGRAIYRGKLPLAEAERRLRRYWHPFHATLADLIKESRDRFGQAVLIDCHSMPHEAIEAHTRPGHPQPEVVLGDRFGAAAGREVMNRIEAAFTTAGFRVTRNMPFAGAYVAQRYGKPAQGVHVVQVEIDRALYMDEAQIAPHAGFEGVRDRIAEVVARVIDAAADTPRLAAE